MALILCRKHSICLSFIHQKYLSDKCHSKYAMMIARTVVGFLILCTHNSTTTYLAREKHFSG